MGERVKLTSRPESAKTQDTKLTLQSEPNISTFSETDTFISKRRLQEKDDFGKYVENLNKKAKYNLPTIAQKKQSEQLKNQTCKPFERRRSSNTKPPLQKIDPQNGKQKAQMNLSKTSKLDQLSDNKSSMSQTSQKSNKFIDKTIRKMNELLIPQKPQEQPDPQSVRINFAAFVANDPLKRQKEAEKKDLEKKEKRMSEEKVVAPTKQQRKESSPEKRMNQWMKGADERKRQVDQLSLYVNTRELRNMDSFPSGYEMAIEQASQRMQTDHNLEELGRLDISQFKEFGDGDIFRAMDNIKRLDQRIEKAESGQTIDNTSNFQKEDEQLEYSQDTDQKSLTQSSLSMLKRNNNLFLTQILKGNLSRQDLQTLVEMEKSHNKLTKLEQEEQFQDSDSDSENQSKQTKDNKFIEKNKIEATGGLFLECDYLSEENKKRLDELMKQIQTGEEKVVNPFDLPQNQAQHLRRLDQGISIYQNMFQEGRSQQPVIYQDSLPKDPEMRRKSELRILRDKITSVNTSLRNIQNIPVDRFKIQSLVAKLKEMTITRPPSAMIESTRKEFDEIKKKVQQSQQFLQTSSTSRQQIVSELQDIRSRFQSLADDLHALDRMTDEEIQKLQRQQIQQQKKTVEKFEDLYQGASKELDRLEEYTQHLRQRIQQIDQVGELEIPVLQPEGFSLEQTMEQLDARISRKAETTPPPPHQ